jgi:hypothetical protein
MLRFIFYARLRTALKYISISKPPCQDVNTGPPNAKQGPKYLRVVDGNISYLLLGSHKTVVIY